MTDRSEAAYYPALDAGLERAISPFRHASEPITLLYSGGVDSSLLAWELREADGLRLLTVGTPDSPDLDAGRSGAEIVGLPGSSRRLSAADVTRMAGRIDDLLAGTSSVSRSVLISVALALDSTSPGHVLLGQGIDELFLGYAHFRALDPGRATARATADLRKLLEEDWPTTRRIADRLERSAFAPYLEASFVEAATSVPIELRLPGREPKGFFRAWAVHRGLPEPLARRPKRALQYGSGVDRILRRSRP